MTYQPFRPKAEQLYTTVITTSELAERLEQTKPLNPISKELILEGLFRPALEHIAIVDDPQLGDPTFLETLERHVRAHLEEQGFSYQQTHPPCAEGNSAIIDFLHDGCTYEVILDPEGILSEAYEDHAIIEIGKVDLPPRVA